MASTTHSTEQTEGDSVLDVQDADLSAAYKLLRNQLEEHKALVEKKSEVIQNQKARITILEERLRLKTIENFAASSESNPLQDRLFNDPEQISDEDEAAQGEDVAAGNDKPKKPRAKG